MRELWARRLVLLSAVIVIMLAFVFARIQNPETPQKSAAVSEQTRISEIGAERRLDQKYIEAGRIIFIKQNCTLCHSIAAVGNSQSPLDGVGSKRSRQELRQYITGSDSLQGNIPDRIRKIKQRYTQLPEAELSYLIIYLQSLK